jgi:ABC-type nitrate/sulfonate/bicarbonate transport system permease component
LPFTVTFCAIGRLEVVTRVKLTNVLLGLAIPLLVIVAWEIAARDRLVSPFLLPPFSRVIARLWEDTLSGELAALAGRTLLRLAISYSVAVVCGVLLGLLMGRVRVVRWLLDPIVSIGFPAPKIAFLPIFILWFGVFDTPKIVMSIFSCIFPIVAGTWAGTQGVDRYLIWSAENLGASKRELLLHVIFPSALPQVLTAMQVALPIAFIVVIVAEMLTGGGGLGGAMIEGARLADTTRVYVNLIVIGLIGFVSLWALQAARRRILAWHPEVLQEQPGL